MRTVTVPLPDGHSAVMRQLGVATRLQIDDLNDAVGAPGLPPADQMKLFMRGWVRIIDDHFISSDLGYPVTDLPREELIDFIGTYAEADRDVAVNPTNGSSSPPTPEPLPTPPRRASRSRTPSASPAG